MTPKKRKRGKKIKFTGILYSNANIQEEFTEVYIENYGYITINNLGTKVYTKTGKFPSLWIDESGYLSFNIGFTVDGKQKYKTLRIHRLVAMGFIPNPNNYPEVNHKNGDKMKNDITNLEWCTGLENIQHAWKNGLIKGLKGHENGRAKLDESKVKEIKEKYTGKRGEIASLAKEYNVSWSLIKFIVSNKNWTHVK